jgi:hypothetical protein
MVEDAIGERVKAVDALVSVLKEDSRMLIGGCLIECGVLDPGD